MKNTYTTLETTTTTDGNTIIYRPDLIAQFFKKTFEENYFNLSKEQKEEVFLVDKEFGDLLTKIWKEPLQQILVNYHGSEWALQSSERNPTEEYEHHLLIDKDEDLSDEEHDLKIQRLKEHKEWFENQ